MKSLMLLFLRWIAWFLHQVEVVVEKHSPNRFSVRVESRVPVRLRGNADADFLFHPRANGRPV